MALRNIEALLDLVYRGRSESRNHLGRLKRCRLLTLEPEALNPGGLRPVYVQGFWSSAKGFPRGLLLRVVVFGQRFLRGLLHKFSCLVKGSCVVYSSGLSSSAKSSCWVHSSGFSSLVKASCWVYCLGFFVYGQRFRRSLHLRAFVLLRSFVLGVPIRVVVFGQRFPRSLLLSMFVFGQGFPWGLLLRVSGLSSSARGGFRVGARV